MHQLVAFGTNLDVELFMERRADGRFEWLPLRAPDDYLTSDI